MTLHLENWRNTLQISKFTLVSHSFSSYVAVSYSLQYPNHIDNIFLISPGGLISSNIDPTTLFNMKNNNYNNFPSHSDVVQQSQDFPSTTIKLSFINYISSYLWNSNFTPMDFLRWLGPLGNKLIKQFLNFLIYFYYF